MSLLFSYVVPAVIGAWNWFHMGERVRAFWWIAFGLAGMVPIGILASRLLHGDAGAHLLLFHLVNVPIGALLQRLQSSSLRDSPRRRPERRPDLEFWILALTGILLPLLAVLLSR